jgi:GHMP kinases N terminal domain
VRSEAKASHRLKPTFHAVFIQVEQALACNLGFSPGTTDRRIAVHSLNFGETVSFDLDEAGPRPRGHWSDYLRGVAVVIEWTGLQLGGADLLIRGGVPLGAGLSSSAALEVSVAFALLQIAGIRLVRRKSRAWLCCAPPRYANLWSATSYWRMLSEIWLPKWQPSTSGAPNAFGGRTFLVRAGLQSRWRKARLKPRAG